MSKAVVISGGSISDYDIIKNLICDCEFIVCADSGSLHCDKLGLFADVIVGDFDSAAIEYVKSLSCAKKADFVALNPVKDDTDTEFAIDYAVSKGYKYIYIVAGIGTRFDHSLANVFLMEKYYDQGVKVVIINENNTLQLVKNATAYFEKNSRKYVSVLPLETVSVTNFGFKYPLCEEFLYRNSSRGISNELINHQGYITVKNGAAVIAETND